MSHVSPGQAFVPLHIAVLTVSDTRDESNDKSGLSLAERLTDAGHHLAGKAIVPDDVPRIRAQVGKWIADPKIQVILITGGTGFSRRDSTPEAIRPLLDKEVEGFGELFRWFSFQEIGTSTIQSRALAGLTGETLIFCLPGSTGACRTAWDKILAEQLDSRHQPCNFVTLFS
jgi:molybdenum cofactor biosynthesis protein B